MLHFFMVFLFAFNRIYTCIATVDCHLFNHSDDDSDSSEEDNRSRYFNKGAIVVVHSDIDSKLETKFALNKNKFIDCIGLILDKTEDKYKVLVLITNLNFNTMSAEFEFQTQEEYISDRFSLFTIVQDHFDNSYETEQTFHKYKEELFYYVRNLGSNNFVLKRLIGAVLMRSFGVGIIDAYSELKLNIACDGVSIYSKLQAVSKHVKKKNLKANDIVLINTLKQQNNSDINKRAKILNGSFGIIVASKKDQNLPEMTKNHNNQTVFLVQSLFEENVFLWLRNKWIEQKIQKFYIYDLEEWSSQNFYEMMQKIQIADSSNVLWYFPPCTSDKNEFKSVFLSQQYSSTNAKQINRISLEYTNQKEIQNSIQKINLKSIQRKDVENILSKLHLFYDNFGFTEIERDLREKYTVSNKLIKKLPNIIQIYKKNVNVLKSMSCFDEISIQNMKVEINKNIKDEVGKLLDLKQVQNIKLWKHFIAELKDMNDYFLKQVAWFKKVKAANASTYKTFVRDWMFSEYIGALDDFKIHHVFVHDVNIFNNFEMLMATTLNQMDNLGNLKWGLDDAKRRGILAKKIVMYNS